MTTTDPRAAHARAAEVEPAPAPSASPGVAVTPMLRRDPGDVVLTMCRVPVTGEMSTHPLATETGIAMVVHVINGLAIWSDCTPRQREVLAGLCRPLLEVLRESGEVRVDDLPVLPASVHGKTWKALERRGLVFEGRLTSMAVYGWYWAVGCKTSGGAVAS